MDTEDLGRISAAKEVFFRSIDALPRDVRLSEIEQDALYSILTSTIFKRSSALAFRAIQGMQTKLVKANLSTSEGISDAVRTQGMVSGFVHAFESLFDLLAEHADRPAQQEG
jgi:hypothetical protein